MLQFLFSEKVFPIWMGLFGGAVSGLTVHFFAPWFKWKLDVKKDEIDRTHQERDRRRKQIQEWRNMLIDVDTIARFEKCDPMRIMQRQAGFLALEPYLSEESKHKVYGCNFTAVLGLEFQGGMLAIKEEISRIEEEWGVA